MLNFFLSSNTMSDIIYYVGSYTRYILCKLLVFYRVNSKKKRNGQVIDNNNYLFEIKNPLNNSCVPETCGNTGTPYRIRWTNFHKIFNTRNSYFEQRTPFFFNQQIPTVASETKINCNRFVESFKTNKIISLSSCVSNALWRVDGACGLFGAGIRTGSTDLERKHGVNPKRR